MVLADVELEHIVVPGRRRACRDRRSPADASGESARRRPSRAPPRPTRMCRRGVEKNGWNTCCALCTKPMPRPRSMTRNRIGRPRSPARNAPPVVIGGFVDKASRCRQRWFRSRAIQHAPDRAWNSAGRSESIRSDHYPSAFHQATIGSRDLFERDVGLHECNTSPACSRLIASMLVTMSFLSGQLSFSSIVSSCTAV